MHTMINIGDSNIMLSDTFGDPATTPGQKSLLWLYVKGIGIRKPSLRDAR